MKKETPPSIFQDNIQKYKSAILSLDEEHRSLSLVRLFVFVGSIILITFFASQRLLGLVLLVTPLCALAFALLITRHNRVDHLRKQTTLLHQINEQEILRLMNNLSSLPTGEVFGNSEHSYTSDMDVFGRHSLFQLLDRTTTKAGSQLLAHWLSVPASIHVIVERQNAVRELGSKLVWRQDLQTSGLLHKDPKNEFERLLSWMEKPIQLTPIFSKLLFAIIPLSVLSTWALVHFFSEFILLGNVKGIVPLAITSIVNFFVLQKFKPMAEELVEDVRGHIKSLESYRSIIAVIESETFINRSLQELKSIFHNDGTSASNEISRLKKILETFQLRGRKRELNHAFYSWFNNLWFLDIYLIYFVEKWKIKSGGSLKVWSSCVGEFEALNSLAGFHYSNPSYAFPKISDRPYEIIFEAVGHPLIHESQRITNNFKLVGRGQIAMVTGSNMAGKSTFLRTVGINMLLGLMGAPCCSASAQISPLKLFSSMRTQDNLEEGVSSFYAELKRIEELLKLTGDDHEIFFLLDEMFKGTNSKDRHRGGFSLMKQLSDLNAFGIVSTHDLDLAVLASKYSIATNYSFNSKILDGEMLFDYRLSTGLCQDFNASELMRRSGIKIIPDENYEL